MFTDYYYQNKQYSPRLKTDVLMPCKEYVYTGMEDWYAKLVETIQLKDNSKWTLFVNQFRRDSDDENLGWRGEYWGKMMRGACITYRYTGDKELYNILQETTLDLLTAQRKDGRFSTYGDEKQFGGWDMWCRKYVLLGLLHFYEICEDESLKEKVLKAACNHADYMLEYLGEGKLPITKTSHRWGCVNSCSVLEPMMRLYNETGEKRYFDFATHIVKEGACNLFHLFEAAFEDVLNPHEYPVVKAYEMMSCFEGLLEYYRVTKIEKWKEAVIRFARRVADCELSIIGCAGADNELFDCASVKQTDTTYPDILQETCVAVTWIKLCTQLLWLTGDISYANEIEKTVYNTLYGSVNTDGCKTNGGLPFDSYSPLLAAKRGRKTGGLQFMEHDSYYGCCAAIGAVGTGMIPSVSVMESKEGVVFHLYCNGHIQTEEGKFVVQTGMPAKGETSITVFGAGAYEVKLRIPPYCKSAFVTVNGEEVPCSVNSYLSLKREWKEGDLIQLNFNWEPQLIHAKGFSEDPMSPYHIAILYGPLVLARDERLGSVGSVVTVSDLQLTPSDHAPFQTICEFTLETKEGKIILVDYSSAGKDWKSKIECWMPTKDYQREIWEIPFK